MVLRPALTSVFLSERRIVPDIPSHVQAAFTALTFRGARPEQLRSLCDAEWKDLLARWEFARFMLPLRQVCGDVLPEWVRAQIDQDKVKNTGRFERIKADYLFVADAIRSAKAEHLVLKGFARWPGYVAHPRFRRQSDIDLYCPPDSIIRACNALSERGYELLKGEGTKPSDHLPPMIRKTNWEWKNDFFDPEMPISVELHFRLWDEGGSHIHPKGLDQFWVRRLQQCLEDFSFPALHPVDGLGYLSLNLLRDLLHGWLSTYCLYELAWFLHTNADNAEFWKSWLNLHDESLRILEAVPFRLASHLFACRLPENVETEVTRLSATVKQWFERYGNSLLTAAFRPNKDFVWLHLALVESSRDRRAVFFKKLFPTQIPAIDAPYIQNVQGTESASRRSHLRRRTRHLTYVVSRAAYHARILPISLWHGVQWWLSTKNLSRGFWTFLAASFFFDFGMYIFFLLYNLYLLDCGFRESYLGLAASATSLGSIAGTIPAGMLAQRLGIRRALLLCMTAVPLIFALRAILSGEASLLVLSFLGGAATTIWAVCLSPAIAQLTRTDSRPFGFSLIFSSGIAVGILGGQTGGHLPGWLALIGPLVTAVRAKQLALLVSCGVMALAIWPLARLRFTSPPAQERKFYPRNPFLLRYLVVIAVWSFAVGMFSPFFNVYFSQHLGMPVKQIGAVYSISHLSQLLAMLAAPLILRRFGLITGIMYTQIAAAVALGGLAAAPAASTAAIIYLGYVALQWMAEPGMFSLLMNQVDASGQTGASALNFLVINVSQAVAAMAAGASFLRFGYPAVLSVAAGIGLIAACMFRLLLSPRRLGAGAESCAYLTAR
jgi:predicted MFS family arabinose efflux permease